MLSERYGVPEIGHLSHADRIVDHVTPSCGLKHSIGFAHHGEGEPLIEWGFTASPEPLRKGLFDFPLPEAMA